MEEDEEEAAPEEAEGAPGAPGEGAAATEGEETAPVGGGPVLLSSSSASLDRVADLTNLAKPSTGEATRVRRWRILREEIYYIEYSDKVY